MMLAKRERRLRQKLPMYKVWRARFLYANLFPARQDYILAGLERWAGADSPGDALRWRRNLTPARLHAHRAPDHYLYERYARRAGRPSSAAPSHSLRLLARLISRAR